MLDFSPGVGERLRPIEWCVRPMADSKVSPGRKMTLLRPLISESGESVALVSENEWNVVGRPGVMFYSDGKLSTKTVILSEFQYGDAINALDLVSFSSALACKIGTPP